MKNDKNEVAVAALAVPTILFLGIIISIPFALFNAWVALTLYGWFLVPLGLPAINIWHMWGIMLLFNRFKKWDIPESKEEKIAVSIAKLAVYILISLLILLIGFLLKGLI